MSLLGNILVENRIKKATLFNKNIIQTRVSRFRPNQRVNEMLNQNRFNLATINCQIEDILKGLLLEVTTEIDKARILNKLEKNKLQQKEIYIK